jgi:hypothetical protein
VNENQDKNLAQRRWWRKEEDAKSEWHSTTWRSSFAPLRETAFLFSFFQTGPLPAEAHD